MNHKVVDLNGMYQDYFLDYSSYVILERAVPKIDDGLKPVQRRILHSLFQMDDGRFHKVANVIGQTMQYHPHGDAAIGAALVHIGQKDLLLDMQGNWGDIRTGDSAAAARYIETRLSKFAKAVAFNPKTTEWQISYDGRKKEPISLPMKFPLVLAQGVEGIAVGLSTKILPHNFIELIKASIKILQDKKVKIYPDFQTGGSIDVSQYNGGKRGGKVKVRAKIDIEDKKTLIISELPYGVTTTGMIDSIVKANEKGKIKIKKVIDNTAADVEIRVELASGVSPEVTRDALFAFTNCEVSISPNACVIVDNRPMFLTVEEILRINTENTKELLRQELEIAKGELEEKWHFASLEKIFIQERIYRDIEECESWEEVIEAIDKGLRKYVSIPSDKAPKSDKRLRLLRDITEEDIVRLTEIRIKRISKYNVFAADEKIAAIEAELDQVKHDLAHLTDYAIAYYQDLLDRFGKGRERRTVITDFQDIAVRKVVANNVKLYVNRKDGFVGSGLKKDEYVCDCSDIDDIIAFRKDGKFVVTRISDKSFVGKNIIHVAVWKKGDERTTYNCIYLDGVSGRSMAKRFQVKAITRDKEYEMTAGTKGSRIYYFSANPNGESEIVHVQLSQGSRARNKIFDFDFAELDIKGRGSKGNILTKYPVRKITLLEKGSSTIGALEWWIDRTTGRLNRDGRGDSLGECDTGDFVILITKDGQYGIYPVNADFYHEPNNILYVGILYQESVISAIYFDGEKGWTMVKRFEIETAGEAQLFKFISDHRSSKLYYATADDEVQLQYVYRAQKQKHEKTLTLDEFVDVKGWKAKGNKLGEFKILSVSEVETDAEIEEEVDESSPETPNDKYGPGDTLELEF